MSSDKQPDGVSDGPVEDSAGAPGGVGAGQDPKNVAELTNYIQSMLQQMQDRWVDHFPIRFFLYCSFLHSIPRFQTMSDQIISRIDDMGARIDDLEHNINDLMSQAGQTGPPMIEKEQK